MLRATIQECYTCEVLKRTLDCDEDTKSLLAPQVESGQWLLLKRHFRVLLRGTRTTGRVPVITQTETYDSNETGGCVASEMLSPLGLLIALGILRRRRIRQPD